MNKGDFIKVLQGTYYRLLGLTKSKGNEYTQGSNDQLINFKEGGARLGVHPAKYLLFGLDKHFNSIAAYVKELDQPVRRVLSEPIEGRIDDLILYAILLKALIAESEHRLEDLMPNLDGSKQDGATYPTLHERIEAKAVTSPASDSLAALRDLVVGWSSKAFPARSLDTVRLKLVAHELPELLVALGLQHSPNEPGEIADVLILLLDYCDMKGIDINAAVREKMIINQSRQWQIDANGISSHLETP